MKIDLDELKHFAEDARQKQCQWQWHEMAAKFPALAIMLIERIRELEAAVVEVACIADSKGMIENSEALRALVEKGVTM